MSVQALVIVNNENIPLLIRTRNSQTDSDTINYLFHIHASIDIIEEKQTNRDSFLGLLTQSETHKIYGLCSPTNTKIIMMVLPQSIRDNEARAILKTVHNAFIDCTSNPFYSYGQTIKSKHLDSVIDSIFETYQTQ